MLIPVMLSEALVDPPTTIERAGNDYDKTLKTRTSPLLLLEQCNSPFSILVVSTGVSYDKVHRVCQLFIFMIVDQ